MPCNDKVCFGCTARIGVTARSGVAERIGVTVRIGVAERIGVSVLRNHSVKLATFERGLLRANCLN